MDISWEDAQSFLAVAEQRSFSAAARHLQLGQPTISRRIADLEQRLGSRLFRRGKQGAVLTDSGARLLPAAEQMARWEEANPSPGASVTDVADHIDHIRAQTGIDHIGLGSDFDGMGPGPAGLEDVSGYPNLTAELLRREYSDEDILKILGRNVLRALRGAEDASQRLRQERAPSEATIEELDEP